MLDTTPVTAQRAARIAHVALPRRPYETRSIYARFRPLLFRGDQTFSAGLGELHFREFAVLVSINRGEVLNGRLSLGLGDAPGLVSIDRIPSRVTRGDFALAHGLRPRRTSQHEHCCCGTDQRP